MNFPTIFDVLARLEPWRGLPSAYVVLITAVLIIVLWDWRLSVLALAVQYFASGLLFTNLLDPRLAIVKLLVGWFTCLILYVTARQVNWGRLPIDILPSELQHINQERRVRIGPYLLPTTTPFRFFLGCMMVVVVWTVAGRPNLQLPVLSDTLSHLNLAVYALVLLGLLGLALTLEPLKAGMGLLMVLSGFELFYSALEQSVAILAGLGVVNLVVALTIAYLMQVRYAIPALID